MSKELLEKIERLKAKTNAVILAHNYQLGEIQDLADFTGDSLALSIKASETDADVIVFCGVLFMAETAAILSPGKTVLLPDENAGCPLADMIDAGQLRALKKKHPDAAVVCYVNSSAEVKALSDYCCTSSNAGEVVNSIPADKEIIFVPDRHLGRHVLERSGRRPIIWPGYCHVHVVITEDDIKKAKDRYPNAVVMVHPECTESVKALADEIFSTGQMLNFAEKSSAKSFIIGTETGIIHTLKRQNPDVQFIPATTRAVCPNMKKITLEKILWSLEDMKFRITVPQQTAEKAKKALDRMVQILPGQK